MLDIPTSKEIATAASKTNKNPTEKQQQAGNYKKGGFSWHGLNIKIENPRGSTRSGTDGSGKKWETHMRNHYGYITRTNGYDGDAVDVFIGPYPGSTQVFVVNQVNPRTGTFDEHKCMIGFKSIGQATKAYLSNYERGWKGLGNTKTIAVADFKKWVRTKGKKNSPQSGALKKIAALLKAAEEFTPDTAFVEGLDESQLRQELIQRVKMIAQLRAHRDSLLDAQSGYQKQADINLDIDKGDTLLVGRFKNKRITVKDIGEDELNQPTVNGRKLLTGRIEKQLPKNKLNKKAFMAGYTTL